MANKVMTVEQAKDIAQRCAKSLEIAGRVYVDFPYNKIDLADALLVLSAALKGLENGVSREEHTKLARQKTALYARFVRLAKKYDEPYKEEEENV